MLYHCGMRRFRVQVVANPGAAIYPADLDAVRAFYAGVCELDFFVSQSNFASIPFEPSPGNAPLMQVNQAWYNANLSLKYPAADIIIFALGPSDRGSYITPLGVMTFDDPHAS